ncbi:PREDICTED: uncharacterized protein LOC108563080 [Nicrophorus vespilloides]|uniref:Uncharacterized protein LOC108563080 n=1 Tax=Nicrophorus vespilloides TaxID=110193 RepID=A0ABM1MRE3_NICVS|nr:PREDICTED: uncharacterized protein LOC108563080 [Nicrophorus vespilloides]
MEKVKIRVLNLLYGHAKIVLYLYALTKYYLDKHKLCPAFIKTEPCLYVLTAIFLCFTHAVFLVFRIYRFFVHVLLTCKLGSDFCQIFDGTDTVFMVDTPESPAHVTVLFQMESEENGNQFYTMMSEGMFAIFSKIEKLTWSKNMFMGYWYYKKLTTFRLTDFVSQLKCSNLSELQTEISTLSTKEFPFGNTALWAISIGSKRLEDGTFPIVFRFHHCFGDAVTLFNILNKEFNNNKIIVKKEQVLRGFDRRDNFITAFPILDPGDGGIFCSEAIGGNKTLVWYTEKEAKLLQCIKSVKKSLKVNFIDVILTAVLASMEDYAKTKTVNYSKQISAMFIALPNGKFDEYGDVDYKCSNKFTLGFTKLPLKMPSNKDLLHRLKLVHEAYDIVKNKSLDLFFNRWNGTKVFTFLTFSMIKSSLLRPGPSLILSNIPGCKHLKFFGCDVKEFVIFDENVLDSGFTLMLSTYENRLSFGFTIDKTIVPTLKESETICLNVIKHIQDLSTTI